MRRRDRRSRWKKPVWVWSFVVFAVGGCSPESLLWCCVYIIRFNIATARGCRIMYLPRIMARIGLFSNVGRFMIIEEPQKLFFPTFVSHYNNPEPYGEQRYESQPEQGSYRGAVPWAGLIFPAATRSMITENSFGRPCWFRQEAAWNVAAQ